MVRQENRIAIISPAENAYSETFIQAQKNGLRGKVFYYYNGELPGYLEGFGSLLNKRDGLIFKVKRKLKLTKFNVHENAFIKSLKDNKIQVILAQYGPTAHRIAHICSYLKMPLVTHFHGYDASVDQIIDSYNSYKRVFSQSFKVIAVSKVMERKLLSIGCPKEKIVYNVCAPRKEFETVVPTYSKKQFLAVGRFTDKKAPYYTIMAFKKVLKKHPDAKLLMAGDGVLLNMCKNLVNHLKLEDNVVFLGVITPKEYINLLEESLAFVQHSIVADNGDMEGTPLSVLEASAAGLPVISTYHAGIPDVIEHTKTGLLCKEHDIETMGEHMLNVLDNVAYARQLGLEGKRTIKKQFSMERHINRLDEVLFEASKSIV
ncbi:glycosyltransferase [Seonamhaeicola sp.]|uniref:glycosyltransferase n=1 Tax=Seonamhaeicola sp. TaxID=1912245 RepID=UPI00262D8483|nr:glycosyltransferase [Seonamhaeicola sp.]